MKFLKRLFAVFVCVALISVNINAVVFANAAWGIKGNGIGGIYIDINAAPYTTYASQSKSSYGATGCTWFAAARVNQLTGKNVTIHSAENWRLKYSNYGFSAGSTPKAPAIICCTGGGTHVAILEKIEGNTAYISEGGRSAAGPNYGYCQIRTDNVNSIAATYRSWGLSNISYVYLDGASSGGAPSHSHSWSTGYESAHPHKIYRKCSSCGAVEYTGGTQLVSGCSSCYPVGSVSLTRSFSKTGRTAEFYRNNVSNATDYTLTLYRNGSYYNSYSMTGGTYWVSGLPSGVYTAELTARNRNTGQSRGGGCQAFTIVDSYPVNYNANGGENAPTAQTKIQNENMSITSSIPTKKGHIFKGWASSKTATEAQYKPGDAYTKNTSITLYAVWEPETYNIHFDLNGGSGNIEDTTITYGNTMKMPNNAVKESFYLRGWARSKTANAPDYRIGEDCRIEENLTLYAVWGNSTWGGAVASAFAGGDGTESNPYQIANASQLAYLANKVNQQTSEPKYEYYKLTDNINLGYEEWVPIGVHDREYQYFCGSFDGNGYTVSDLLVSKINAGNLGLFGYAKDSEIKNMNVAGEIVSISSTSALNIGAFAGYADNTKFDKCSALYFNISDLSGGSDSSCVGCVAGRTVGGDIADTTADNCYINLREGSFKAGIIVGKAETNISGCKVTSSEELFGTNENAGTLYIGGICGELSGNITNCAVDAGLLSNNIRSKSSVYAGGLVGSLSGRAEVCSARFVSASAENSISVNSSSTITTGGLIGKSDSNSRVADCMYDGKSITSEGSAAVYAGGLIGRADAKYTKTITVKGGLTLSRSELPTRAGYTAAWYTDPELKNKYDFSQPVSSDMTLYAKWSEGSDNIEIWDGTSSEPQYNSTTKTYTIKNGRELAWISDVSNGVITTGKNFPSNITFEGYTIELANDVYLNDTTDWENWESNPPENEWKEIGNNNNEFAGTFNGKGYSIIGIYSDGLFYAVNSTSNVMNLSLSRGLINSEGYNHGAISKYNNGGTISNCHNYASVSGRMYFGENGIGGIIGVSTKGKIEGCSNSGAVLSTTSAGGLGGIAGDIFDTAISNCYNEGTINSKGYGGSTGGIIGFARSNDKSVTILNCYNVGSIIGSYAGGIVGQFNSHTVISKCYNTGHISLDNSTNLEGYKGGISGYYSGGEISYCYNIGTLTGQNQYGIAARMNSDLASIKYSYATQNNLYSSIYGTKITITSVATKSSSQMKSLSNLPGFSTSDWGVDPNINNGYPYLKSMENTYKNYKITVIEDAENAAAVGRSFVNVDGSITGTAGGASSVGGILGFGSANGQTSAHSDANGLLSIADLVEAKTTSGSSWARSGDIAGDNSDNSFGFDNVHTYSGLNVKASNSGKASNAETSTIGTARTKAQITRSSFLRGVFGPDTYQSLDYLKNHPDAVWVIRDGEMPELYSNLLRDITVSTTENGTISVDKPRAADGELVTVTAVPSGNYRLNTIYVNGKEIDGTTFTVEGDSDVYATFNEKTPEYSIKVSATDKADATLENVDAAQGAELAFAAASGSISAPDGDEIRVNTTAADKYTVDAIRVNGEELAGDSFIVTADSVVTMDVANISTDIKATTYDASDIFGYYATLGGSVEDVTGAARYIRYWAADNPTEVHTTEVLDGGGAYSVCVEELMPNTTYQYQMCETGEIKSFKTLGDDLYVGSGEDEPEAPPVDTPSDVYFEIKNTNLDGGQISADVVNVSSASQSGTAILAAYAADGALVSMQNTPINGAAPGASVPVMFTAPADADRYKLMIWNSLTAMTPMAELKEIR